MKKLILILLLCSLGLNARVKLDLKTKFTEKADFKYMKLALITKLNQTTWSKVVEFKEDYQIWIDDYNSIEEKGKIISIIRIKINKNTLFKKNELDNFLIRDTIAKEFFESVVNENKEIYDRAMDKHERFTKMALKTAIVLSEASNKTNTVATAGLANNESFTKFLIEELDKINKPDNIVKINIIRGIYLSQIVSELLRDKLYKIDSKLFD